MSEKVDYYNTEYAPIADQYREAEERENQLNSHDAIQSRDSTGIRLANQLNTQDTSPNSDTTAVSLATLTPKRAREKRRSRYDEDLYALPDIEEGESVPSPTIPTSSRELAMWKGIAITSSVLSFLGIVTAVAAFIYVGPASKGWFTQ